MSASEQERLIDGLSAETFDRAGWDDVDRALIAYADKLTRTPGEIREADLDALRGAALDDRAIHDACAIVGYFAFVNRIADGLGVEVEPAVDAKGGAPSS